MPSRMSIGDWRLPVPHLAHSGLILPQLAGPFSPSYDQTLLRMRGGGVAAATAAAFLALAACATRAAWLARMMASRAAILADRSASASATRSRSDSTDGLRPPALAAAAA